jgi:uncharacterized coiled-coil DUF342 family protein
MVLVGYNFITENQFLHDFQCLAYFVWQEAELARVQATLQYRNEGKINEAIQRLQTQLQTRNFTLAEEKKLVSEIDSLKRSKKNLG